ncbi:Alpha/Beta hydrolase protein, partial [Aspergillus karnatakaensis]|uniref:alpha/beta hydrolase family protein n=1 Tax=Aspergillus karnatakaensis TaxID=1810916 RepID=UPI003CCD4702
MKLSTCICPLLASSVYCRSMARATNTTKSDPDDYPTFQLSSDSNFNFNFVIALGNAVTGGSDIGPVLGVAKDAAPGDLDSYSQEWYKLANQTKAQAEDPDNAFDPVNVRDTWFSASHYFRRADEYVHGNWSNPLINTLWNEQTAAFDKAIAALPKPGKRIQLPAKQGGFLVEAIWYEAPDSKHQKRPTLIIGNGFDAAQEDSYHYFVAPALARGWNCITYEGPGQPTVVRNQSLGFIPDWENVLIPVVDYLFAEKSDAVDTDRLVLVGNSFGGYLAARAAAFEPRLAAAILIGGVWDVYPGFSALLPPELKRLYESGNHTEFDHALLSLRDADKLPTEAAWGIDYGLWAFQTQSPSEFFTKIKEYHIRDIVNKINIPVFIGDAEYENIFPGQPQQVKDALGDRGTLHVFNGTAGYHCQSGAIQEMTRTLHAWLHKTLLKPEGGY